MSNIALFRVKNFEHFQHYKDRNPPWIRFYNSVLDDYEIGRLPDASKAHLFAIWLLASRYDNKIPYDAVWVGTRINATTPVDLRSLVDWGIIELIEGCINLLADCKQVAMPEESRGEQRRVEDISSLRSDGDRETGSSKVVRIKPRPSLGEPEGFPTWYEAFPRHIARRAAARAYAAALQRKGTPDQMLAGARRYASEVDGQEARFIKHPATWLNGDCWGDSAGGDDSGTAAPKAPPGVDPVEWYANNVLRIAK